MTDPLDPCAVLETLAQTVTTSSVTLRNQHDAFAAVLHAALVRLDFRLVGLAEEDRLSDYPEQSGQAAEGSSSSSTIASTSRLPSPAWFAQGPESYTFRYRHDQSSLTFLIKVIRMSSRILVHASSIEAQSSGESKTASLEVSVDEYTSKSYWPYPRPEGQTEPLVNGFIGASRLKDLLLAFKGKVVQKLVPGLRKDGYQEETSQDEEAASRRAAGSSTQQPRPRPPPSHDDDDPLAGGGVGGVPYRPGDIPGRNPLAIGDRDLQPLGGMRPPGSFGPPPLFGGGGGGGGIGGGMGGGMYPSGLDDPLFRDRFPGTGGGVPFGGGTGQPRGPWGGDGFLPPGAVPPGARFDPIGPMGPQPGFPGQGGAGRGGQAPPGSGDPDWDDVRPPRSGDYDSMFQ
ncbi:hypothetical protein BDZ90DRAFT_229001 [Jaminaea rosea]|uniref:Uncharacterized protein n=1 Tax=Jaminaea rosea TaxID=1569628 RepID=A0A316UXC5_9BASI|nr:hypothetical protein BDZ90DRAFT_229001 [Jaminaea rosea]PWN29956.1 hypothetical protein BDZ90DRAFT_229001 [Jaminaea rosea]